jgi:hypothetical protein
MSGDMQGYCVRGELYIPMEFCDEMYAKGGNLNGTRGKVGCTTVVSG